MTTAWAAAERLARGLPLREALDHSCARSWVALDLGVRILAWESPHLLPAHAWADGRRLRWDWNASGAGGGAPTAACGRPRLSHRLKSPCPCGIHGR